MQCTSQSFSWEIFFQSKHKRQKNNVKNMFKADYKSKGVNDIVLVSSQLAITSSKLVTNKGTSVMY